MTTTALFDDELDGPTRTLISQALARAPSEAALRAATQIESDPSPAMLEQTARWIEARAALEAAAVPPGPRALLHAAIDPQWRPGPGAELLADVLASADALPLAIALCERIAALPDDDDTRGVCGVLAAVALARVAATGAIAPHWRRHFQWSAIPAALLRATLAPLPLAEREQLVLGVAQAQNPDHAVYVVERLLEVADLVPTPAVLAARDAAMMQIEDEGDRTSVAARVAAGITPPPPVTRPTPEALRALDYWLERFAQRARIAALGPLAEATWAARAVHLADAPELATWAAWSAAGDARRRTVAEALLRALVVWDPAGTWSLAGLETFAGGAPIAVFDRDGVRFCAVPGGDAEIGLSDDELAAVDARAAEVAGAPNHHEQYGSLHARVATMRPLTRVRIGPLLAAQGPALDVAPAQAVDLLEASPFRLPSEAEWEHLARGGVAREVTYRGAQIPDHEDWLPSQFELGVAGANRFGLWAFGFEPELCADVFVPDLAGLPPDGSPRRGPGPRAVRGGAGQVYPWQACGEWQLLLSAVRNDARAWPNQIALRYVVAIVV